MNLSKLKSDYYHLCVLTFKRCYNLTDEETFLLSQLFKIIWGEKDKIKPFGKTNLLSDYFDIDIINDVLCNDKYRKILFKLLCKESDIDESVMISLNNKVFYGDKPK